MKKIFATIITFLALCGTSNAKPLNLNEVLEATCRVGSTSAYGTGTVIAEQNNEFFILTNAHVVGKSNTATVEFFTQGAKTLPILGNVVWKAHYSRTDVDFALITIPASSLQTWQPRIIPLANRDFDITANSYVQSAGCPEARWPMAWEGRITQDIGSRLLFTPPPTGGQSGSALLVNIPDSSGELHTRVGGIVTWRIGSAPGRAANGYDLASGGAIPVSTLYNALEGKVSSPNQVPSNYSLIDTNNVFRSLSEKALGNDGNYYDVVVHENGRIESLNVPLAVEIIRWPDLEVRLPANPLVPAPIIGGGYDYGYNHGGYSIGNGGYNSYNFGYNDNSEEIEKLKEKLEYTQEELNLLKSQRDKLLTDKQGLEASILEKDKEFSSLIVQFNALKESSVNKSELEKLSQQITQKQSEINLLSNNLKVKEGQITEINERLGDVQNNIQTVSFQRNTIGGLTLFGVLSFAGWLIWSKFGGRNKVKDVLDNVEDRVQNKVSVVVGDEKAQEWRDALDALEKKLGDRIEDRLDNNKISIVLDYIKSLKQNPEPVIGGEAAVQEKRVHPWNHPDYVAPPKGPVYQEADSTNRVVDGIIVTGPGNGPQLVEGLPPTVPEYPARKYTPHEIIAAIEEVSYKYPEFRDVPHLIAKTLKAPRRPRTNNN